MNCFLVIIVYPTPFWPILSGVIVMTRKKLIAIFLLFIALFSVVELRLFYLMNDSIYTEAASLQGTYTRALAASRPNFYDRYGQPLTGQANQTYAVAYPGDLSSYNILKYTSEMTEEEFADQMQAGVPFLVPLTEALPASEPISTVEFPIRYSDTQLASHLLGYLNYEGNGASGLEAALNNYFTENTSKFMMSVDVDALGRALDPSSASFYTEGSSYAGVWLSLDSKIQALAEQAADNGFTRGAIVVLDAQTSEIAAILSRPDFDSNNIAAALEEDNGALFNRSMAAYNVGSIYKLVVGAAALEAGISPDFSYECRGFIEVNGRDYYCFNHTEHGRIDSMEQAFAVSCNGYFIELGQQVGAEPIYNMAAAMGLGKSVILSEHYSSAAGVLPTKSQLSDIGELCNHSFGQGLLMATPLQVAAYTACIAAGGTYRSPSLISRIGDGSFDLPEGRRIMSEQTAEILRGDLQYAMESGLMSSMHPQWTTAAGKTGTAQTGVYDVSGREQVIAWLTGWFPAENPRYVITVMVEHERTGASSALPVFCNLADAMSEQGF